jgi:hypothetical protein
MLGAGDLDGDDVLVLGADRGGDSGLEEDSRSLPPESASFRA